MDDRAAADDQRSLGTARDRSQHLRRYRRPRARRTARARARQDGSAAAKLDFFTDLDVGRWTFLAETMFEAGSDNAFERRCRARRGRLSLSRVAARVRGPVSHCTRLLQRRLPPRHVLHGARGTAATAVEFEDGGGLIPAHNVGVHARRAVRGRRRSHPLRRSRSRTVAAAIRSSSRATTTPTARRRSTCALRYEPSGVLEGLIVGGNIYFDSIPANRARSGLRGDAFASDRCTSGPRRPCRILRARHALRRRGDDGRNTTSSTPARPPHLRSVRRGSATRSTSSRRSRATSGRKFPDEGDPYYAKTADDGYQTVSVGLKHSTTENIALKVQAGVTFSIAPARTRCSPSPASWPSRSEEQPCRTHSCSRRTRCSSALAAAPAARRWLRADPQREGLDPAARRRPRSARSTPARPRCSPTTSP